MFWDTEQTKSFAVSWLKSILLYNYRAGNKRRWEMSYSRVSLFSLLAKSRILSFTRNIWRKMSFQVKFQFKIRQKCRSKWNDIGHTLELGHQPAGAGDSRHDWTACLTLVWRLEWTIQCNYIGENKKSDSCLATLENSDNSSGNYCATLFNLGGICKIEFWILYS